MDLDAKVAVGSLSKTVELLELPGSRDGIMQLLEQILSKPIVESVHITQTGVEVTWYRAPHDKLLTVDPDEDAEVVLGRIDLREETWGTDPNARLARASAILGIEGSTPTIILTPSIRAFKRWVGFDPLITFAKHAVNGYEMYMGMFIIETDYLEPGTLVVCGSRVLSDKLYSVERGIKLLTVGE